MEKRNFIISTETTCDMDKSYYEQNNVNVIGLTYTINDKEYDSCSNDSLSSEEFYKLLREGAVSKTAQVYPEKAVMAFEKLVEEGYDVLHIAFSSGLSGTYQSCKIASEEVLERHPEAKIIVIDSLSASMGQGLLLNFAVDLKNQGKNIDEIAKTLEANKLNFCHNFTVDDLNYLHRGGRVSKSTAIIGTVLGIKPLLHVDNEGKLINVGKVRGRKASLDWLVDKMAEKFETAKNEVIYIVHADAKEDAKYVEELVKKRFGIKNIVIGSIGPVIGSHSGPGTVALFFVGKTRDI